MKTSPKIKLEMIKAWLRGSLRLEADPDNAYLQGYEAGLRAMQEYIASMEKA